jgi:hypothetical protein
MPMTLRAAPDEAKATVAWTMPKSTRSAVRWHAEQQTEPGHGVRRAADPHRGRHRHLSSCRAG